MYKRFTQLLKKHEITAYRVSKETGVTQTTLSDWKTGRSIPRVTTLQKIADYFDVSLDWLMGREDACSLEQLICKDNISVNRKAELYEEFAQFIFETLDTLGKTEDEIKNTFLDLGMTEEEYEQEIRL